MTQPPQRRRKPAAKYSLQERDTNVRIFSISGRPGLMSSYHQHSDVELNYLSRGSMTYLFSGVTYTIDAGCLCAFWAAVPHQVISISDDPKYHCLHISLSNILQWNLPDQLIETILGGRLVVARNGQPSELDRMLFEQWHRDITSRNAQMDKAVHLEIEARMRRLAVEVDLIAAVHKQAAGAGQEHDSVERMAAYIAHSYTDPITIEQVARHVDLHPKYAMTIFRQRLGLTLVDYITRHRVSHAQRLLATTDTSILDIAFDSGFGSASRFYEAFADVCDQSPRDFRKTIRASV
jgi:AraC-like DNA-binding protein/quercetin dioxygenase-like cupin family protein